MPDTVDPSEVAQFDALAATWWDEDGPMRPLHRLAPARLGYLRERLVAHFGRDGAKMRPFEGLRLLDVGCGGGLVSEPMARMGFAVTGIDAAERNVGVAAQHAAAEGLAIDYRNIAPETLAGSGDQFDAVLALEVIEHVTEPEEFVQQIASLLRPGGVAVFSTLNRTLRSYALGIVAAEYLLRWLPRGTHRWDRFVKPSELAGYLRRTGLGLSDLAGIAYDPLHDKWRITRDVGVNYFAVAVKAP